MSVLPWLGWLWPISKGWRAYQKDEVLQLVAKAGRFAASVVARL